MCFIRLAPGGQPYSDMSPYEVSECYLILVWSNQIQLIWGSCFIVILSLQSSIDVLGGIIFFKCTISGLFFFIFVFSIQLTVNNVQYKVRRRLDSNCGPLVLEATALPTEPQPLPLSEALLYKISLTLPNILKWLIIEIDDSMTEQNCPIVGDIFLNFDICGCTTNYL